MSQQICLISRLAWCQLDALPGFNCPTPAITGKMGSEPASRVLEMSSSPLAALGRQTPKEGEPRGAGLGEGLPPHWHLRERKGTRNSLRSPDPPPDTTFQARAALDVAPL